MIKDNSFRFIYRLLVSLVVLAIPVLLVLKIIQVMHEPAFSGGPGNFVERLGYGVLRRIKDTSFWLIVAMVWVFARIDAAWHKSRLIVHRDDYRFWRIAIGAILGAIAVCCYIEGMRVVHETFSDPNHPIIQKCEGSVVSFVILMAAYHWVCGVELAVRLKTKLLAHNTAAEEAASVLLRCGLVFAVAGILLTVVVKWIREQLPIPLNGTDPTWRVVGEIAVGSIPFLALSAFCYCYFLWFCKAEITFDFIDFPLKVACRAAKGDLNQSCEISGNKKEG